MRKRPFYRELAYTHQRQIVGTLSDAFSGVKGPPAAGGLCHWEKAQDIQAETDRLGVNSFQRSLETNMADAVQFDQICAARYAKRRAGNDDHAIADVDHASGNNRRSVISSICSVDFTRTGEIVWTP